MIVFALLIVIALLYLMAYYLTGLKYGYYLSDYVYLGFILKTILIFQKQKYVFFCCRVL